MEPTHDSANQTSDTSTGVPENAASEIAPERSSPSTDQTPQEQLQNAAPTIKPETKPPVPEAKSPESSDFRPKASTPEDLVAAVTVDQDSSLDKAVEEAMMGITSADLSAAEATSPSSDDPKVDALVTGRIANVGTEDVLIDFGAKTLGVMPRAELDQDETYEVGANIEVLVIGEDTQGGLITVSRKKAKQEAILRNMKVGMVLEGPVTGMNKGGLEITVEGLRGFIPASQVDTQFVKDISDLIGTTVRAEVTKFDLEDKNIVLSRRKVLAREETAMKEKMFTELEVGQTKRGRVQNLAEYGAFVDIGGMDGLLHISDMSWGRVQKPDDIVKIGDEIEVKIIKINQEKKKISLSLKQTLPNPWDGAETKYSVGTKVKGNVVRLANFGAFVELEPGVDALLPVSEMSWTRRVRHPKEIVKEGDPIEASIIAFEPEDKRISLSLKAMSENPWSTAAQRYEVGTKIKGKVVRTTDFGAFVNLEDGVDGLIHISELSENRVRAVTDVVKVGEEIEARVLSVDSAANKIGLTLKTPPPEPSPEEIAQAEAERARIEKRPRKKRRGGITFGWDEGLSGLDPSKFAQ
ncbi:MAG: S1 RNA-binding domain-containing protein [Phycisphaerales bacterium]|nr:S1 RNA-binding domain-containing protein [Phycisphaerales bacterium]